MTTIFLILSLVAFWLGLSGHYTPVFFWLGGFSVLMVVIMKLRLSRVVPAPSGFEVGIKLRGTKVLTYWLWLLVQIVKSNWLVVKIILSPRMNLSPHFVEVAIEQKSMLGVATFANSITLTPGTISMKVEGDKILVHALNQQTGDLEGLRDMGARVLAIETEKTS